MRFTVGLPIAGEITTEVEARNQKEAIKKAWEKFDEGWENHFDVEWEAYDKLTEGNCAHFGTNEAWARAEKANES